MSKVLIENTTMTAIADAIRAKSGKTDGMLPSAMAAEITNLPSGGITNGVSYDSFDENGNITEISIHGSIVLQEQVSSPTLKAYVTTINLDSKITDIPSSAFYQSAVTSMILPEGLTSIGDYAFYKCSKMVLTELPPGLTSIGRYAFRECSNLAITELPPGLTSIGEYAFYQCSNLAITELPPGLTSIGVNTFRECSNLAITELPPGLTSIGNYAFRGCSKLTKITFKSTPDTIDASVFDSCWSLKVINVPWAEGAVANAPWGASSATINYNYVG